MILGIMAGQMRGAAGASDPYWSSVVSCLEFDGTNGSTTFTDFKGKVWTANGSAQISTARSAGGSGSLLLDGTADYISTPYHADFDLGAGDLTIEWFQYIATLKPLTPVDFRGGVASSPRPLLYNTFSPAGTDLFYYLNGADRISAPSGTLVALTFQHVAYSRVSGVGRLFVDGNQVGADYSDSASYTNNGVFLGRNTVASNRDFNGNIDGWRVTKGVGRYSGSFAPPSLPYPKG